MSTFRIALANIRFPATPEESVALAEQAIAQASIERAGLICFPECFVPGYRGTGEAGAAPRSGVPRTRLVRHCSGRREGESRGCSRHRTHRRRRACSITALVINRDGTIAGFQDKVQLDPSEEGTYSPGSGRRVFQAGPLTFGVAICHEGWRYPETVRWAARHGAHIVFHPHFHEAEPGGYRPVELRRSCELIP